MNRSCQQMVRTTKGLPEVLHIGWLRMGSQNIQLKNQALNKLLKHFVLDISYPVAIISAVQPCPNYFLRPIISTLASDEVNYFFATTDFF